MSQNKSIFLHKKASQRHACLATMMMGGKAEKQISLPNLKGLYGSSCVTYEQNNSVRDLDVWLTAYGKSGMIPEGER